MNRCLRPRLFHKYVQYLYLTSNVRSKIFQHLRGFGLRVSAVKLVPQNCLSSFQQEATCYIYSCEHFKNFTISANFPKKYIVQGFILVYHTNHPDFECFAKHFAAVEQAIQLSELWKGKWQNSRLNDVQRWVLQLNFAIASNCWLEIADAKHVTRD